MVLTAVSQWLYCHVIVKLKHSNCKDQHICRSAPPINIKTINNYHYCHIILCYTINTNGRLCCHQQCGTSATRFEPPLRLLRAKEGRAHTGHLHDEIPIAA